MKKKILTQMFLVIVSMMGSSAISAESEDAGSREKTPRECDVWLRSAGGEKNPYWVKMLAYLEERRDHYVDKSPALAIKYQEVLLKYDKTAKEVKIELPKGSRFEDHLGRSGQPGFEALAKKVGLITPPEDIDSESSLILDSTKFIVKSFEIVSPQIIEDSPLFVELDFEFPQGFVPLVTMKKSTSSYMVRAIPGNVGQKYKFRSQGRIAFEVNIDLLKAGKTAQLHLWAVSEDAARRLGYEWDTLIEHGGLERDAKEGRGNPIDVSLAYPEFPDFTGLRDAKFALSFEPHVKAITPIPDPVTSPKQ